MKARLLALIGIVTVLAWPIGLATTAAQTAGTARIAPPYTPPRTSWGDPDLQGIYTNQTLTPLERPATLGSKAFFTKEEADARAKRSAALWPAPRAAAHMPARTFRCATTSTG